MTDKPEVLLETSRFRVVRWREVSSDGRAHVRDIVEHPGSVAILALLENDRVCLIRNRRIAAGETLIELPAGTLDRSENLADAARRELIEETGYRAGKLQKIHEFFVSPGFLNERMHLFLATELSPGKQELEAGEEIERLELPWDEALRLAQDGTIKDAKTIVALLLYDRLRAARVR